MLNGKSVSYQKHGGNYKKPLVMTQEQRSLAFDMIEDLNRLLTSTTPAAYNIRLERLRANYRAFISHSR